ncbi:STAS domain-containing protein [Kitasatospora camelliae]|uniref:STAS domain-containing protein n=1 Tax=Kitasatospora camelliae TaxID=3156397 RepID=A0AAU8K744_9ACTN
MGTLTVGLSGTSDRLTAVVTGEIDQDNADVLRRRLSAALRAGTGRLVVDMTGVEFCDSRGLHTLVAVRHEALAVGRTMTVVPSPIVRRLLEITDTLPLFQAEGR